jgi:hypothetical protein
MSRPANSNTACLLGGLGREGIRVWAKRNCRISRHQLPQSALDLNVWMTSSQRNWPSGRGTIAGIALAQANLMI